MNLILKGVVAAILSVVLTGALLAALVSCTPATTRALCDTSGVVLEVARPATVNGKLAAEVGRFIRGWFCPKTTGATDRLCPRQRPSAPVPY